MKVKVSPFQYMTVYRQSIRVILNLDTRWTIVAIFTSLPYYPVERTHLSY